MKNYTARAETMADDFGDAYDELSLAMSDEFAVSERVFMHRETLAARRAELLRETADDPKKLGVNEAAREATLAGWTEDECKDLSAAETSLRAVKASREQKALCVESLRAQLRILEVLAKIGADSK